jgi:hypothetical protein
MPGIQVTGKPSNAAAGGSSFNESMLRAGISNGDAGAGSTPGLSASGLQSSFTAASASVRMLGVAANQTAAALNSLQMKINNIRVPAGGGSGGSGGGRYIASSPAAGGGHGGGRGSASAAIGYRRMSGHALRRIGSTGGIGGLTGALSEALEAAPEMLPVTAMAALAFSPQIMAGAFSGFMGATSPYRNFAMSAYGMSRAGGFNGDRFISNLSDNGSATGSAMSRQLRAVGLGSTDAMSIMQQFGIGPQSSQDFVGGASALARMSLDPNLGSMDQSQLVATQRMLVGGGLGAINTNTAAMSDLLANATSRGLDKSVMIQSMQNSLSTVAAGGGLGANLADAINFNRGMFDNNNLAARNGSAASSLMAGISASFNSPFSSPAKAMMLAQTAAKIHTVSDLVRVIGPGAYGALTAKGNTAGLAQVWGLLDPSTPLATKVQSLGSIMTNSPASGVKMSQNFAAEFTSNPATQTAVVAGMTGTNLGTAYNALAGLAATDGSFVQGMDSEYRIRLRSMGIPASQVETLIAAGKAAGVSPVILGGQFGAESSFGLDKRAQTYKKGGYNGAFQMGDAEFRKYGSGSVMNFRDAAYAAARYDAALGMTIDPTGSLARYNGETDGRNTYSNSVFARIAGGQVTPNVPVSGGQQTQLNLSADNSNAGLNGAKATFSELKGSVDELAQAAAALQGAVTRLVSMPSAGVGSWSQNKSPTQNNPFTAGVK